jgi:hypothetical protein
LQVGAAAPLHPLSAALGLSCRRRAIVNNETLGRWGLPAPHHRFSLRSADFTDGSLPGAKICSA